MIIPSIDLRGGQAVQLVGGRELALEAGDPLAIAATFSLAGPLAIIDLDAALGTGDNAVLVEQLCRRYRCRVGGGIRSVEAARRWLDAGAEQVILGTAATPEILARLPRERVIAALDAVNGEVVVDGWRTKTGRSVADRMAELGPHVAGFLVTFVEREGRLGGTAMERVDGLLAAAGDARVTFAGGVTTAEEIRDLDARGADAQVGMALYTGRLTLAEAVWAPVRSGADGLVPTVIADEHGVALGLAWSNRESLSTAVSSGTGVYWSRSRDELWRKGATSGATQELLAVDLDCDRDALRFTVRQAAPGFCHEETRTCWGPSAGLAGLDRTLAARLRDATPGSYTQRLLADPALLASKLREETEELLAAAAPRDVAHEAADVLYFTMVACARAGVRLEDVERELDRRALRVTRRTGDAKPAGPPSPSTAPTGTLRRLAPDEVAGVRAAPVDPETLASAEGIVTAVRVEGEPALRRFAERFGDLAPGAPVVLGPDVLAAALESVSSAERSVLERTADRIRAFAEARRADLLDTTLPVPGGEAGVRLVPVQRAGCYAPGGRYPLPSSVLMTAITAKAAGVPEVWVASPSPAPATLAAAALAGAEGVLAVGGAQAIAALAHGVAVPPCDAIVGPGNRWVTAAKQLVAGTVAIDMLAGPSELLVLADGTADPERVAADLLAQAEHDVDAVPMLAATDSRLLDAVDEALARQLATLPTAGTARAALSQGFAVQVADLDEAVALCNRIAPEHLALHVAAPHTVRPRLLHYGALFVGGESAEVLGDYGAGPNHVLPTGGTARSVGALDVMTFLRPQGWLEVCRGEATRALASDAAALARIEGLEAHARAADLRASESAPA